MQNCFKGPKAQKYYYFCAFLFLCIKMIMRQKSEFDFNEDSLPIFSRFNSVNTDNWHLYLEYQRLNELWNRVEERDYSEDTKEILKMISDKQYEILKIIKVN